MKRLILFLLLSSVAFGQGFIVAPKSVLSVVNGVTRPVANATITVCAVNASGIPCTPALVGAVFKDAGLTQPLSNPFTTDANGNYQFAIAGGIYTVTETAAGFAGYSYQLTVGLGYSATAGITIPVESFGAVGDWNGTTGTDNTAAIQACINAVSLTTGTCTFQGKSYKISSPLSITKNAVGLSGLVTCTTNSAVFLTPPVCANIVQTSASADIIDVAGISSTQTIGYNEIKNLRITRSVIPTGTAKGLSISFTYGTVVDRVESDDSIYDYYFKGVGSAGTGHFSNSEAAWGYNGITETTGNLYGFYVDSTGGVMSPSIRFRDTSAAANFSSGPTTYGVYISGTLISDFHAFHMETASTNYGVYVNQTGGVQAGGTDLHFVDFILDGCLTYCMQINNVLGTVSITGGWDAAGAASTAAIDVESSANVSVVNRKIFLGSAATGFLCHNSTNTVFADSTILNGSGTDILMNGCTGGSIASVNVNGTTGSPILSYTGSSNIPVINTTLQGTAVATGFSFDSASHNNFGLETDSCISGITTCLSDSGSNFKVQTGAIVFTQGATVLTGTGACLTQSASFTTIAGQTTCTGTTGASTLIITPGFTAPHGFSCFANDVTHTLSGSQSAISATACTMTFTSVTANDILTYGAVAY